MTRGVTRLAAALIAAASLIPPVAAGQEDGNTPAEPFRIADNLYFVGSSDIGSYLVTTPARSFAVLGSRF
jgi:metallo-beta-lactamase class B